MPSSPVSSPAGIAVVVVLHESARVVAGFLHSVLKGAPRHGVDVVVVDNDSHDEGPDLAAAIVGPERVVRLSVNAGFATGVNEGWRRTQAPLVAVLNPDTIVPPGALDALAEILARHPEAGLVAPRVVDPAGRPEATAGRYPTLARERAHALLGAIPGIEARRAAFPAATAPVDWVSGCAWLLRRAVLEQVGPLDEGYFMYFEDVDFCRRLTDAGWHVLATPEVTVVHEINRGSAATNLLPADGGSALLRYFEKFHPEVSRSAVRRALRTGWAVRRAWRQARALLGDRASAMAAERYRLALEALRGP